MPSYVAAIDSGIKHHDGKFHFAKRSHDVYHHQQSASFTIYQIKRTAARQFLTVRVVLEAQNKAKE
ncbi:hypothetical protein OZX73_07750 [Bifidobacterium sp. ESL0775]|uniref:hypothetical protein n=1 Tax=Bifidobacterium sp. ESL0775 TaxID=2983230 RepID=UPI0023F9189A|nr:hypothetical protein [Bifidobacterium sp. ESL0775]WEV69139.1 hypothetical protein OZX73_07750 [Bifidobacterium sp. ESL0775]